VKEKALGETNDRGEGERCLEMTKIFRVCRERKLKKKNPDESKSVNWHKYSLIGSNK